MKKQNGKFLRTVSVKEIKKLKNKNQNTHISLFTGCGGLDLGLAQAGWITRVMIEWDKSACETLRCNWTLEGLRKTHPAFNGEIDKKLKEKLPSWYHTPEPVIMQRDITTVTVEEVLKNANLEVGECGMVSGGFPCQGFSMAGPRMIDDKRNVLYKECVRMIRGILPRSFLLENVQGLISMGKGKIIDQICTDLAESGYQVSWQRLNAADYGVPQNRIRVFFIGFRNDVLIQKKKGNPQYHLGGSPGPVQTPQFFKDKYKIINKYEQISAESLMKEVLKSYK